ncbi:MAG: MFS transporter [Bacilli bacterium]|nr:MFS transporter [Bacilli bacterium]
METVKTSNKRSFVFDKGYRKRTIWIGLAFFGILLVWQLYNSYCSPMLSFLFARSDYASEVNAGALAGYTTMKDLLAHGYITEQMYLQIQWKVGIIMALDNIAALFIMPIFGHLSDKTHSKLGKRMPYIIIGSVVTAIALPFIPFFFSNGMANQNATLVGSIVGMICSMIVIIVFMMSYRSPAVALMPDLTPKPLRSKANGLINIVGYVGGAVGSVFAIVIPVTKYIDGTNKSLFMLEIPFLVCSVVLLISLGLLLYKVRENKLHEQLDKEIRRGDKFGESAEDISEDGKLSKNNMRNLVLILIAEVLWFMSLNAVETFQTNYVMFWLNTSSAGGAVMTIISGAASVVGFLLAGVIADKIGRKWTIFLGICVVAICYLVYAFIPQVTVASSGDGAFESSLPWIFFILLPTIGLGSSLIHICSFPLVTDYCTADKLGRFTSLYYTASMLAQSITPIAIGFIFIKTSWQALPIYSASLMAAAGLVFFFVKAPKRNDHGENAKGIAAIEEVD